MADDLRGIAPPSGSLYRVTRRRFLPFTPPGWEYTDERGTFGNRFDDPGARDGIPEESLFRVMYCATRKAGAFGETLAYLRPSRTFETRFRELGDAESEGSAAIEAALNDTRDPDFPQRGLIPIEWRLERHVGVGRLDPSLRYVNVDDANNINHLRDVLLEHATDLGFPDVDLSAITSTERSFTQRCARYIYECGFAGIRYFSRLNAEWECWALFDHRTTFVELGVPEEIRAHDSELLEVAKVFQLTIEGPRGQYTRPWRE